MSSSWSDDLPDDILLLIVKKVMDGYDFKSFSQVCSSWRSISKPDRKQFHPVLPGVLTKQESMSERNKNLFESLSKLKGWPTLSFPKENNVVCGSRQGWIVMREESNSYEELVLINPVTQDRFKLPFSASRRIIFSANPMDYNCYIVPVPSWGALTCCKLGDEGWTVVQNSGEKNPSLGFVDAIYYRGKLYYVSTTGELFVCDDITASPPMMTKLINTPYYLPVTSVGFIFSLPERFFLVESGQELLLVYCKDTHSPSALGTCASIASMLCFCGTETGFEVYRLDIGCLRWDRVTNLGEHALFLGKSQSFSLSELEVRGIKGNHIYYIEEHSCFVCVFSLENSRVEFLPTQFPMKKTRGIWFMPQLFS